MTGNEVAAFLPKPFYGDPCNSCGLCCFLSQCPISELAFGRRRVCPAIEPMEGGGYGCGVMRDPGRYIQAPGHSPEAVGEAVRMVLGAGAGCDAVHGEADLAINAADPDLMRRKARADFPNLSPEALAFLLSIGGRAP